MNLKLVKMKNSHFWKIVIGAVSAALGYILSAIGV
nr:MAG TPA: holin [Microviridae sp.]